MLLDAAEFSTLIGSAYVDVTDKVLDKEHLAAHCPTCDREVALQVEHIEGVVIRLSKTVNTKWADFSFPFTVTFKCPICSGLGMWIVFRVSMSSAKHTANLSHALEKNADVKIYRIAAIPPDGINEIEELPKEPASLRTAYGEAIQCLSNNCPMAAAAMFRRALQIITRDILGARPGTLASELSSLRGNSNKLGITLTSSFDKHSFILKEIGNQAAHPDKDPDLLSFSYDDAYDLYGIFLEIVSELFIVPQAAERARRAIMERRKIRDRTLQ